MRIPGAPGCFWGGTLVRLPPDSARTRNVIVKMIASQKNGRAAFNLFIVLISFSAPMFPVFFYVETEPHLTHYDSASGILRKSSHKRQAESWANRCIWLKKGNTTVTKIATMCSPD
jgi:hypothetical protein